MDSHTIFRRYPNAHLDPDLLLNSGALGVQVVISAPGRYFRYSDTHVVFRNNPENPVEVQERMERLERARLQQIQMLQEALGNEKAGNIVGSGQAGMSGDKRELLNQLMALTAQGGQTGGKNGPSADALWTKKSNMMNAYDIYMKATEPVVARNT